ncbi:MAG: 6-carboxytetrahydropterin synthase [Phycisphaerae bacterium]|jgi:6-pyruvoyltetrahydropterin/6-carboxytetrahydropterin synthase
MVYLTREVRFSIDRDWAGRVEFSRPVTNSWGGWPSAVGIVPYLKLRATVTGEPDPVTGYLCNIALLDDLLRRHAIPHTADVLRRHGWRMTAERLLQDIWRRVADAAPAGVPLVALTLCATPALQYSLERENPDMVHLTQQFEFSAAHRLHCPQFSADENRQTFGKCNNPNGHGHNYLLEITVVGEPDPQTGAVLPLPRFEQIVQERVVDYLDHRHLNADVAEFHDLNPSVENISRVIWRLLCEQVAPATLHCVRVWETPKTWAECCGA